MAGELPWKPVHASSQSGYIDAMPVFEPENTNISYFALCYVTSLEERAAQLRVSGNDGIAVWVNGDKVHEDNSMSGANLDSNKVNIVLPQGTCPILLQICQGGGDFRILCTCV